MPHSDLPATLGELRASRFFDQHPPDRTLKDELRSNLICKLERGEPLFPGVMGYDDTVVPQIVNAILSRHNFILLGLRGQAKSRILRFAWASQNAFSAFTDQAPRHPDALRGRLRNPRSSAPSDLQSMPGQNRGSRR